MHYVYVYNIFNVLMVNRFKTERKNLFISLGCMNQMTFLIKILELLQVSSLFNFTLFLRPG